MNNNRHMALSGHRIEIDYIVTGDEKQAREKMAHISVEQTIEFPADLVSQQWIKEEIVGRLEQVTPMADGRFAARVSYAAEVAGGELGQLLNLIYGNISLVPGVEVNDVQLPSALLNNFFGPRFGMAGLRSLLGVAERPLLCTALKPMGLGAQELGQMAYRFARGGIDIIKDDHGLADQPFCPFHDRVARASEAVAKANTETGKRCLYAPMVSGPDDSVWERIRFAKSMGAGALVVAPGLAGFDLMARIASSPEIDLPLLAHPSFLGGPLVARPRGISHGLLLGTLMRLAGADCTIFPSFGGRFSFTPDECTEIAYACRRPLGHIKAIFPGPAGGMSVERAAELTDFYGRDVVLLVGGDLHRRSPDLTANALDLLRSVL